MQMKTKLMWQFCKDLNDVNKVIDNPDPNWEGLESADQIINIEWSTEHKCYQIYWRVPDDGDVDLSFFDAEVTDEYILHS